MAVPHHVLPHEKAQSSHHHQGGGGQQGQGVPLEAHQAGKGPGVPSLQVESGVAEGGHRVEQCVPQAPEKPIPGDHGERQQDRPQKLKGGGAHQRVAHHPHHPVQVVEVQGGHDDEPLGKADAPVGRQGDKGDDRHKAQPAQLDEQQDHRLAEGRPGEEGVRHHQPGDAGGRGGGEEGGKEPLALPRPAGKGQAQQEGAQENDDGKGPRHQPGGVELPGADKVVPNETDDIFQHSPAFFPGNMGKGIPAKSPAGMPLKNSDQRGFIVGSRNKLKNLANSTVSAYDLPKILRIYTNNFTLLDKLFFNGFMLRKVIFPTSRLV